MKSKYPPVLEHPPLRVPPTPAVERMVVLPDGTTEVFSAQYVREHKTGALSFYNRDAEGWAILLRSFAGGTWARYLRGDEAAP